MAGMRKVCFIIPSTGISGGIYVVFEHALRISRRKVFDVYIVQETQLHPGELTWFPEANELKWLTFEEANNIRFDAVIATWWETCYEAYRLNADNYLYFNQSVESRFYKNNQVAKRKYADSTYLLGLGIITEANWIKNYLKENYNLNARLVLNGIRKDIFNNEVYAIADRDVRKLRVLIEGPLSTFYKNTEKTIELCQNSKADELWLLTSSPIKSYEGVNRIFSQVLFEETASIYKSCDLIVKLSYVEGMFGPPLEMFHCGGTAVVYNVSGFNEYIVHDHNALVADIDDEDAVLRYINILKDDPVLLERLKKGALKTAAKWHDWEVASLNFEQALIDVIKHGTVKRYILKNKTLHFIGWYDHTYIITQEIEKKNQEIEFKNQEIEQKDAELNQIFHSKAWRFIILLRRIKVFIVPPESWLDRILALAWKTLCIIRLEGFNALLKRSWVRIKRKEFGPVNGFITSKKGQKFSYETIKGIPKPLFDKAIKIESSGEFDHMWYLSDNPYVKHMGKNPIQHYLMYGIHDEKNPTPLFNTTIYTRSQWSAISKEDAFIHFLESGRLFAPGAYKNADILITAQRKYFQDIDVACVKDDRKQLRNNAVFFQCGAGSIHKQWLFGEPRKWDLLVSHYDQTYLGRINCDAEFQQAGKQPGTKFTSFNFIMQNMPEIISSYDYILFLDDDILFRQQYDVDLLFSIIAENKFDLAQASLTPDSYCAHPVFKNKAEHGIRHVNAVEIMMPVLSQRVIQLGKHLFGETVSGWGLDLALSKFAGLDSKIVVIDDVVVKHSKPINVEKGAFYEMLHRAFIYPEIELTHFQRVYNLGRNFYESSNKA